MLPSPDVRGWRQQHDVADMYVLFRRHSCRPLLIMAGCLACFDVCLAQAVFPLDK